MLNEWSRNWSNTPVGKAIQCKVFGRLVELVAKMKDHKYESLGRDYLVAKIKNEIDASNTYLRGISFDGKMFENKLTAEDCIHYALYRLEEHGLVRMQQYSKGCGIKVTKKGYDRWAKRN